MSLDTGTVDGRGGGPVGGRWLSVQAAAEELEVTTRTIYRFINDGKLAAYRIGRVYRIQRADLELFLQAAALQPGDLSHLVEDRNPEDRGNGDRGNGDRSPEDRGNGDRDPEDERD